MLQRCFHNFVLGVLILNNIFVKYRHPQHKCGLFHCNKPPIPIGLISVCLYSYFNDKLQYLSNTEMSRFCSVRLPFWDSLPPPTEDMKYGSPLNQQYSDTHRHQVRLGAFMIVGTYLRFLAILCSPI